MALFTHIHSTAPPRRHHTPALIAALLVTLGAALTLFLLSAASAPALIDDDDADPCWDYYIDGPAHGLDTASDVAMTGSAIWVAGMVTTTDHGTDASLARIPREGEDDEVQLRTWDRASHLDDAAYRIAVRKSYVYTCGATQNAAGDRDILLIRWASASGQVKWAKTYAGSGHDDDVATDVAVDSRGDVIVCGFFVGANHDDWVVRKYSRKGTRLWTWRYDGPFHGEDAPAEMVVDSRNNVIVTGGTQASETSMSAYTVKLSSDGALLWDKTYRGPSGGVTFGRAIALAKTPRDAVYVSGSTLSAPDNQDGFLLRYTRGGSRRVYERADLLGIGNQSITDIAVVSDGKIIGVGSNGPTMARNQYFVLWNADGSIDVEHAPVTPGDDFWQAVATDGDRGIYMTGRWDGPTAVDEIATYRWSTSLGGRWWYSWADDAGSRHVSAIAVNGLTCAVVGDHGTGVGDTDQFVHVWMY